MSQIFKNFADAAAREIERKRQADHEKAVRYWAEVFGYKGPRRTDQIIHIDAKGMNAPNYLDGDYAQDSLPQSDNWVRRNDE